MKSGLLLDFGRGGHRLFSASHQPCHTSSLYLAPPWNYDKTLTQLKNFKSGTASESLHRGAETQTNATSLSGRWQNRMLSGPCHPPPTASIQKDVLMVSEVACSFAIDVLAEEATAPFIFPVFLLPGFLPNCAIL